MNVYTPGDGFHGFTIQSVRDIPEFKAQGILLVHDTTGCEVYHLAARNEENVFSFCFKTPPSDDTGVAHIIEHSVLSGSRRYPLKDPFISLMKGSVQTYLNASTYPDKTIYPGASVLKKDYFNLMSVYGDAVFFPLLSEHIFRQEGHRIDASEDGRLDIQGVVFSEMQGVYSSHDDIAGEWAARSLYPDSPYGYEYGGHPSAIPGLTYQAFREFHRVHYHPSNCRIFLYGDIPTEEQCAFLQENFLRFFPDRGQRATVSLPERWTSPVRVETTSPLPEGQNEEGKTSVLINFRTLPVTDPVDVLSMEILTEALMGNEGAPITKVVQDSELGDDLSPVSGLESHLPECVFTIGIRGSDPEKADEFEKLILETLTDMADTGIESDIIEGAMRVVEFRNREIRGGIPFGLRLMGKALRGWMNGTEPEATMLFNPWMEEVRRRYDEGGYFEGLIRSQFLRNSHRSTVIVRPDREYSERESGRLTERLEGIRRDGGPELLERLQAETREFYRLQGEDEDPEAAPPSLSKGDLPDDIRRIDTAVDSINGIPAYSHDLFTNRIVYVDIFFNTRGIDGDDALLLPFFSRVITSTGLPGIPYDSLARLLALKTGGFYSFLESGTQPHAGADPKEILFFRMKMLEDDVDDALDLLRRILMEAVLDDTERLEDLLSETRNDYRSEFLQMGHSLAALRAAGRLSPASARDEAWRGVTQFLYLEGLAEGGDRAIAGLPARLTDLRKRLFTRDSVAVHVAAGGDILKAMLEKVVNIASGFPTGAAGNGGPAAYDYLELESLVVESAVGFASTVIPASRFGSPEHPVEVLIGRLLSTGYLWEKVRMSGGAYGVFAGANGSEGLFSMTSYRDPGVAQTLEEFRKGLEFIAAGGVGEDDLEKVIITTIGKELRPLSPAEESILGLRRTIYGISDDLRLERQRVILEADPEDLRRCARLLLDRYDAGARVVLAGKPLIEKTVKKYPEGADHILVLPV